MTRPRRVRDPYGREWIVRSRRFRRPPWRSFGPDLDEEGWLGSGGMIDALVGIVIWLVVGFFFVVLVPLAVFLVEAPAVTLVSLFSRARWIEATHEGPPLSRMTWKAPADRAEAVVGQVGRQLELGYPRIQPHGAEFVGLGS